jgi:hypothetical protein
MGMYRNEAKEQLLKTKAKAISLIAKPGLAKIDLLKTVAKEMGKNIVIEYLSEFNLWEEQEFKTKEETIAALLDENSIVVFDEADRNEHFLNDIIKLIPHAKATIVFTASRSIPFENQKMLLDKKHECIHIETDPIDMLTLSSIIGCWKEN